MVRCSFCNKEIERGTGKMYISKIGKIKYFCSSKCEKNAHKLKRVAKNLKWTKIKKNK